MLMTAHYESLAASSSSSYELISEERFILIVVAGKLSHDAMRLQKLKDFGAT